MPFKIHKQLLSDTHYLGKLSACHLLLHKNALVPWFILVPEVTESDLLDVPVVERERILNECAEISGWIKQYFDLSKINFAAIGNLVPQLHLHIIGRNEIDACWPKPVWGNLGSSKNYTREEIESIKRQLVSNDKFVPGDDPGC